MANTLLEVLEALNNLPGFPEKLAFQLGDWLNAIATKPAVANIASLPASGNEVGDMRVVIAEESWYFWNGSAWVDTTVSSSIVVGDLTVTGIVKAQGLDYLDAGGNLSIGATNATGITIGTGSIVTTFPGSINVQGNVNTIGTTEFVQNAEFDGNVVIGDSLGDTFTVKANAGFDSNVRIGSVAGGKWIARTITPYGSWDDVVWAPELGLFCAVSGNGRIATSPDGINWTSQTAPANNSWISITWAPELGLFCAVAGFDSGTPGYSAMTSPDGISWTLQATPASFWGAITWSPELGLFCAVSKIGLGGVTNKAMTSPDGVSWTLQTTPPFVGSQTFQSVAWSSELGLFCAVSIGGVLGVSQQVMTSPDGITWTLQTTPNNSSWNEVVWSPELGLFCAVAILAGTTGYGAMTSPDGINWTLRKTPGDPNGSWAGLTWAPEVGLFCAVSYDQGLYPGYLGPKNEVMTSPDGINWNVIRSGISSQFTSVAWSPALKLFCAVASSGSSGAMTSAGASELDVLSNVYFDSSAYVGTDSDDELVVKASSTFSAPTNFYSDVKINNLAPNKFEVYGEALFYDDVTLGYSAGDAVFVRGNCAFENKVILQSVPSLTTVDYVLGHRSLDNQVVRITPTDLAAQISTRASKENLQPYEGGLSLVEKLQPHTFAYKHDPEKRTRTGLVAEDLVALGEEFEQYVLSEEGQPKAVFYIDMIGMLINAVKELSKEVKELRALTSYFEEKLRS